MTSVSVEGNSRIESSTVIAQINTQAGKPLDPAIINRDVKEIFRSGFFEQVSVRQKPAGNGVAVIFSVKEKPAIKELKVVGTDAVSSDTFLEKLNLSAKKFLDRKKINVGIEEVKKYYQSKGYYGTEIEYSVKQVGTNQVDVTFNVTEGEKKVIRELSFQGNQQIDSSDLRDVLQTSRYKWWISWLTGSGVVKQEDLDTDVKELTKYYLNHGFVDVKIAEPLVEQTAEGLIIVYKISEGPVFHYRKITASGTLLDNSVAKTIEGIDSKSGDIFNAEKLHQDTFKVSDKFTDIGYAFANVDPLTSIDREQKKIDLNFQVNKGRLIHISRINISGNQKTNDNVIRRSLKINETDLFSSSKIRRSQELLQRLGYFDEVTITPEPALTEDEVDLGVSVKEGSTGSFSAGVGFSTDEGFLVNSQISENNLFGTGNSVGLNINTGSQTHSYVLSFNNPRVNDSQWSLGTQLLSTMRKYSDFDLNQTGGSVTAGYPLVFLGPEFLDDVRFSLGYELMQNKIDSVDQDAAQIIKDSEGSFLTSSVLPQLVRNTINNPLNPTKGSRQSLRMEFAGLGGDSEYWKTDVSNTFYQGLWDSPLGKFVFSQRTTFGYGEAYNGDTFPLFRRYFPGGINSVRGYDARHMGPHDANDSYYGGNKQLVGNFELIIPLVDSIGLNAVTFYDVGNAFDDEESINISDLRQAFGWGIRWRTPIAPIRLEIGYPLDPQSGDSPSVINFSFGSPM